LRRLDHLSRPGFRRVPHPRSPAARTFDWSAPGFLHPDSPAARYVDWTSGDLPHPDSPSCRGDLWDIGRNGIDNLPDAELTQLRLAAEISLDKHSGSLRDALPDLGLQVIYDRQISRLKEAYSFTRSFTVTDPARMLLNVQRQIDWVHCHLRGTLTQSYQTAVGPILDAVDLLEAQTLSGEKAKLLSNIQVLSERYYTAATESIQEHLADARKTGKQQELIQRWRAQMLLCASAGSAGVESPAAEPQAPAKKPPKKSSDAPVKTWIAVQLIDDRGDPVPNAAYKVTLPDGSVMNGSLDDQGIVRFDEIDPGECLVSFPEIHAKEWKPV
jgi:hypothetical protein